KMGITKVEALKLLHDMLTYAKSLFEEVEIITEDGSRSNIDFLVQVAKQSYAHKISHFTVADTVGFATPKEIEDIFKALTAIKSSHSLVFGIHCHNDLGFATINSFTAMKYGARQVHLTINGIGERAGNTSLEEIAMNCYLHDRYFPYKHNLELNKIWKTSQLVAKHTGIKVPSNKAIIGENTFSHGSGIHQDGMMKNDKMYEIFSSEIIGAPKSKYPITRHSGKSGLRLKVNELGIELDDKKLNSLLKSVKNHHLEKIIDDILLIKMINSI
ncbi:hypothetical protein N9O25_01125, partial [Flavobacteriaceae bacterium]|nr:hypothetical protein [Flavobacteriaceae bacterium]